MSHATRMGPTPGLTQIFPYKCSGGVPPKLRDEELLFTFDWWKIPTFAAKDAAKMGHPRISSLSMGRSDGGITTHHTTPRLSAAKPAELPSAEIRVPRIRGTPRRRSPASLRPTELPASHRVHAAPVPRPCESAQSTGYSAGWYR